MPVIKFTSEEVPNAASTGYMEATRLSPITPKNKAQILKDYQLSTGAAKGMNDTEMSRLAAQSVLDKFTREREEAKRIVREAEAARVAAENAAKAAVQQAERDRQSQIAAQNAQIQQEAAARAQLAAQQAAIAARSLTALPNTAMPVPVRLPPRPYNEPYVASKVYVAPTAVRVSPYYATRIASSRAPVIR